METSLHSTIKALFKKESLQEVEQTQLQEYISQYPYSSIGHLLLAKKNKELGVSYTKEAARVSLYIHNPVWAPAFLSSEIVPYAEDTPIKMNETGIQSFYSGENDLPETTTEKIIDEGMIAPGDQTVPGITSVYEPIINTETEPTVNEISAENETIISSPENKMIVEEEKVAIQHQPETEKLIPEKELLFEPYHTVDYFASLGIKLKPGELGNDKLGRQLKSFTEWLRSMKRVSATITEEVPADIATDALVQKNAEESIEGHEVETEAMAEVWIKQGKTSRAKAIYQKLSLINPSKSHYFASKIEQLND